MTSQLLESAGGPHGAQGSAHATQEHVIVGVISEGRRLARTLGFPTANVVPPPEPLPPFGVYVVHASLADGRLLGGVANLGCRPTFGESAPLLEVHLFDFDEDLCGQRLETRLLVHLRGEQKFASIDELKAQIEADAAAARALLRDVHRRQPGS